MKRKETAKVVCQENLAPDIYSMWLETSLTEEAGAGQFVALYPRDKSTLLPRPISICEVNQREGQIRIVYRTVGKGTGEFSTYGKGQAVGIMGVLGNGFPVDKAKGKKAFLMGGGIGIPPILQLAKEAESEKSMIIAGYRDGNLFLKKELEKYGDFYGACEDGSMGTKGNVLDAVRENNLKAEVIFACGPMPMLRAVKRYAAEEGISAYISLEERMACGIGACLGCVCNTVNKDSHSHVKNARICTEGPVFEAGEVDI